MYNEDESFEWDQAKALANSRKHRVQFTEARDVFYDEMAITMRDDASRAIEERYLTIGRGAKGRLLVVVYTHRGSKVRLISARKAHAAERRQYEE